MNLEDLKDIWQAEAKILQIGHQIGEADVAAMLQKRGIGLLKRINRGIYIEVGLLALIYAIVMGAGPAPNQDKVVFWSYNIGSLLFFLWFYAYKHYLLNRVEITVTNVRDALGRLTRIMRTYMKIYTYTIFILFPVLTVGSLLYGALLAFAEDGKTLLDGSLKFWLVISGVAVLFAGFWILLTRWYVHVLYGKPYQKLLDLWQELESPE
ncbi:MAG: hypothetical protein EAZ89_09435 [Bacteroidetes bacterium]|nr:MAG: hypothetical protein EAZ89_09435 [Bacteroidota bacterium]